MKKANTNEPCPAAKRSRQKITNSESLDRLIDLEEDRRERGNDLIESIKSQNQSLKDKNDAIITAEKGHGESFHGNFSQIQSELIFFFSTKQFQIKSIKHIFKVGTAD